MGCLAPLHPRAAQLVMQRARRSTSSSELHRTHPGVVPAKATRAAAFVRYCARHEPQQQTQQQQQQAQTGPQPPPLASRLRGRSSTRILAHAAASDSTDGRSEDKPRVPASSRYNSFELSSSSTPSALAAAAEVTLTQLLVEAIRVPVIVYCAAVEMSPLFTKACTSLVGFMLGDIIAQHLSHPDFVDTWRVLRLGTYGFFLDGPTGGIWYELLEKYVCPERPNGNKAVLLKTAADQLIWAPITTVVFFVVIKALEGHPEQILSTVHDKTIPTLLANFMMWPVAHLINFKYVPHNYRILYNNCVCVAWLTWLSLLTYGHHGTPAADELLRHHHIIVHHHEATVSVLLRKHG